MANTEIPQEILLQIFSRLPAKSVAKCRTLSKSWKTNLSTPNFIKKHLITRKQTIQQQNLALVTQNHTLFIFTSPTAEKFELLDTKCSFQDEFFNVLGSCNGLILLNCDENLILVNPITRKKVNVQLNLVKKRLDSVMYGLGYDSCNDDYKIVKLSSYLQENVDDDGLVKTFVDVYSVKSGVWKRVDDGCYPWGGFVVKRYGFEGGAFVNGALHWLVCSKEGYRSCIGGFDLGNEVFREIALPEGFVGQPVGSFSCDDAFSVSRSNGVSVVGGCLAIVDNHGNGVTDVWVMREYGVAESWVKFRIKGEKWHSIVATLSYVDDGELLCLTSWDYLFACDLKGGRARKVVLDESDTWFSHGMAFVDSLIYPDGSY